MSFHASPMPVSVMVAVSSAVLGSTASTTPAQDFAGDVATSADRWMYPFNATPGTRPAGSVFGVVEVPANEDFDNRDAQMVVAFDTTAIVDPGLGATAYEVDSILIEMTLSGPASGPLDSTYDTWRTYLPAKIPGGLPDLDPGRPIELFAAGFRDGFSRTTWQENTIFSVTGPFGTNHRTVFTAGFDGEGVLFDVSSSVNDQLDVAPLAIATFPGVSEGDVAPEGSIATFDLDVSAPGVRDWLSESLDEGRLVFAISSMIFAAQGDGVLTQFYLRENPLVAIGLRDAAHLTLSGAFGDAGCEIPGDLDGDCEVDGADLGVMLAAWGSSDPTADLTGDGMVGGGDLGILLANWGG